MLKEFLRVLKRLVHLNICVETYTCITRRELHVFVMGDNLLVPLHLININWDSSFPNKIFRIEGATFLALKEGASGRAIISTNVGKSVC